MIIIQLLGEKMCSFHSTLNKHLIHYNVEYEYTHYIYAMYCLP